MNFTVPEITIPGLNDAPCGLNPKIEELNAIKNKAAATIDSLTSSTGGIADSIGTLGSSISSSVSEVAAKLNKNLPGDCKHPLRGGRRCEDRSGISTCIGRAEAQL